jgi:hypothetical protein
MRSLPKAPVLVFVVLASCGRRETPTVPQPPEQPRSVTEAKPPAPRLYQGVLPKTGPAELTVPTALT